MIPPLLLGVVAIPSLIALGVSLALTAASYFLMQGSKTKRKPPDFTPTTLAQQGDYVPLLIGRRRIGCVMAWAGNRSAKRGRAPGGKGGFGGKKKTDEFYYGEVGWQLLCVGPATKLYKIWADGKLIFDTEINSTSTPSGSALQTTNGDGFKIYWGELTQPINTFLGDASRVGISSRWPHVCYIEWNEKLLGTSPRWPQHEFDLECAARTTILAAAYPDLTTAIASEITGPPAGPNAAYAMAQVMFETYPHGIGLDPALFSIFSGLVATGGSPRNAAQAQGAPALDISAAASGTEVRAWTSNFPSSGLPLAAGWYDLHGVTNNPGTNLPGQFGFQVLVAGNQPTISEAHCYLTDGVTTIDLLDFAAHPYPGDLALGVSSGGWTGQAWTGSFPGTYTARTLKRYVNLAAGTWTLHWGATFVKPSGTKRYQFGLGPTSGSGLREELLKPPVVLSSDGSFFDLATLIGGEGQVASVIAADGAEAGGVVASVLQDMGALWLKDLTDAEGRHAWRALRHEASPIAVEEDLQLSDVQVESVQGARPIDRMLVSFSDVARSFRESVFAIDEDGQARDSGNVRAQRVSLPTVVHAAVATAVGERRTQEALGAGVVFGVDLGRDAGRTLLPGDVVQLEGVDAVLRVLELHYDTESDATKVKLTQDLYGCPATTFEHEAEDFDGGDVGTPTDNLEADFVELPAHAGGPGLVPLRIRGDARMHTQLVHLSPSGTTYVLTDQDAAIMSGGTLTSAIAADADWELEDGPTFDVEGVDLSDVAQDLSADEPTWRLGRQLLVIGEEIFYLRNVEALTATSYRLHGLLRARFDTVRALHSIGAPIFVVALADLPVVVGDPLITPGQVVYMKQQAQGQAGQVTLAATAAVTKTLVGKGIAPMAPSALEVLTPQLGSPGYLTGNDVAFRWAYRTLALPQAGAGMQPAGAATGTHAPEGTFEVEVYDALDVLVATHDSDAGGTEPTWTYANADLVTDLGGETDFSIKVRNVNGGWRSDPAELAVEFAT